MAMKNVFVAVHFAGANRLRRLDAAGLMLPGDPMRPLR